MIKKIISTICSVLLVGFFVVGCIPDPPKPPIPPEDKIIPGLQASLEPIELVDEKVIKDQVIRTDKERINDRTLTSYTEELITFDNNNTQNETFIYPEPIHYKDKEEKLHPIEKKFEKLESKDFKPKIIDIDIEPLRGAEDEFDYVFFTIADVYFSDKSDEPIRLVYGENQLEFEWQGIDSVDAVVKEDTITFPSVLENIDLKYTISNTKVKEEIILAAPNNDLANMSFILRATNLDYVLENDIKFYEKGTENLIFVLEELVAEDAVGHKLTGKYEITPQEDDSYLVRILVDFNLMYHEDIVYPIIIDPTSDITAAGFTGYVDGWVSYTGAAYNSNVTNVDQVRAGRTGDAYGYIIYRGFIDFNTGGLPDTASITDTDLWTWSQEVTGAVGNMQINDMTSNTASDDIDAPDLAGLYADVGGGTTYVTATNMKVADEWDENDLGATADSDLEGNLANDFFTVGLRNVNEANNGQYYDISSQEGLTDSILRVTWTFPGGCTDWTITGNISITGDVTCSGTITITNSAALRTGGTLEITAQDLVFDAGHLWGDVGGQATTTLTISDDLIMSNGSSFKANSIINVTDDMTIGSGCVFSADDRGHIACTGNGVGETDDCDSDATRFGGGAGHGGTGGANTGGDFAGPRNGISLHSNSMGSGGGGTAWYASINVHVGGTGGGIVDLTVGGTLTVDGDLSADGGGGNEIWGRGGGGAGGTIDADVGVLAGSGDIQAEGGNAASTNPGGGGGGGGRIYLEYDSSTFSGTWSVENGDGTGGGANGTDGKLGVKDVANDDFWIQDGWEWQNGYESGWRNIVMENAEDVRTEVAALTLTLTGDMAVSTTTWILATYPSGYRKTMDLIVDDLIINNSNITGGWDEQSTTTVAVTNDIVMSSNSNFYGNFDIDADNFTIESGSRLSGLNRGYNACTGPGVGEVDDCDAGANRNGGGAGHGGDGGASTDGDFRGIRYGLSEAPVTMGSGGGGTVFWFGSDLHVGGRGGGLLLIDITDTLTVDGIIDSDGGQQVIWSLGGGGAGGGIVINTATLAGSGNIEADGSNGSSAGDPGGGGGAGRIWVECDTCSSNITYDATGGAAGGGDSTAGEGGKIGVWNTTADDLNIVDGWEFGQAGQDTTYANVTVENAVNVEVDGNWDWILTGDYRFATSSLVTNGFKESEITADNFYINNGSWKGYLMEKSTTTLNITNDVILSSNSAFWVSADITATNLTIESGSSLYSSARGYYQCLGPGHGLPCGCGGCGNGVGGGGAYGGDGGAGSGGAGGTAYGVEENPLSLGSSGGGHIYHTANIGAAGGGLIVADISDSTTITGTLRSDGGAGIYEWSGGGSGGGINLTTAYLYGAGSMSADGGDGGPGGNAGGAGGGRIRLNIKCIDYSSITPTVDYGDGTGTGDDGDVGTIFYDDDHTTYSGSGDWGIECCTENWILADVWVKDGDLFLKDEVEIDGVPIGGNLYIKEGSALYVEGDTHVYPACNISVRGDLINKIND